MAFWRIVVAGILLFTACSQTNHELKVVGGTTASSAYFFYANPAPLSGGEIFCGASRIGRSVVLTAAHCVAKSGDNGRIGVVIGKSTIKSTDSAPKIPVKQLIIHPEYDPYYLYNDIALLILEEHSLLDEVDGIIQLPQADETLFPSEQLKVIGFGFQSSYRDVSGKDRNSLQEAQVPVINNGTCETLYRQHMATKGFGKFPQYKILPSQICAGYPEQGLIDSCNGDSGGPLFRKISAESYEIIGIVSRSFMLSNCAEKGTAGIYTRVSSFVGWIHQTLDKLQNPVAQMRMHELVGYGCYHLNSFQIKNENLTITYRYPYSEPDTISAQMYQRLGTLPSLGECDLMKAHGIRVKFVTSPSTEGGSPFALISDGQGRYLKQDFEAEKFERKDEKNTVVYMPSKVFSVQEGADFLVGETPVAALPKDGSTLFSYEDSRFSYRVSQTSSQRYYAQVSVGRQKQYSFELMRLNMSSLKTKVQVEYIKRKQSLVVHNYSTNQIVTWQISCPFAFKVRNKSGREIKSELFESRDGSQLNVMVFRHPDDAMAVISPQSKLELAISASSNIDLDAFSKCSAFNDSNKVVIRD